MRMMEKHNKERPLFERKLPHGQSVCKDPCVMNRNSEVLTCVVNFQGMLDKTQLFICRKVITGNAMVYFQEYCFRDLRTLAC